jgi:hypothetical protein
VFDKGGEHSQHLRWPCAHGAGGCSLIRLLPLFPTLVSTQTWEMTRVCQWKAKPSKANQSCDLGLWHLSEPQFPHHGLWGLNKFICIEVHRRAPAHSKCICHYVKYWHRVS